MSDSPVWKRPSDVMKIHRRRKSISQKRITTDPDKRTSVIYKSPSKAVKRRNPFSCNSPSLEQPAKRQNIDEKENKLSAPNCQLFGILDEAGKSEPRVTANTTEKCQLSPTQASTEQLQDKTYTGKVVPSEKTTKPDLDSESGLYIPVDWSLKTKLRVVSSRPLNWCTQLRSTDEALGVTSFVENDQCSMESIADQKKLFQRSCMYWIHPNLPWVRLFPRILDDSTFSKNFSPLMQDDIQKCLQADWQQSFTSAYHQLRSGLCPYFYLCTHQFTVLFYHGKEAQSEMVALATPTTRGFRESLETEGITFRLPVGNKCESPDKTSPTTSQKKNNYGENKTGDESGSRDRDDDDDDGDDLLETDDAASGWLETLGLDKKEFPSLDPKKVKIQREGFRVIDHRPESLVCIEGSDVQAFFNFLLNCRTCTATSGVQAGVPPTILSPTTFKGATLKSHKVKHTAVKQSDREGNISHAHIVEVTGALLPDHCRSLVSLYHHTQRADFGVVYNNHDPTVPFNVLPKLSVMKTQLSSINHDDGDYEGKFENTLDSSHSGNNSKRNNKCDSSDVLDINKYYRNVPIAGRVCAIKELVCTPDKFSWTT